MSKLHYALVVVVVVIVADAEPYTHTSPWLGIEMLENIAMIEVPGNITFCSIVNDTLPVFTNQKLLGADPVGVGNERVCPGVS